MIPYFCRHLHSSLISMVSHWLSYTLGWVETNLPNIRISCMDVRLCSTIGRKIQTSVVKITYVREVGFLSPYTPLNSTSFCCEGVVEFQLSMKFEFFYEILNFKSRKFKFFKNFGPKLFLVPAFNQISQILSSLQGKRLGGRRDTQHNDTRHNDTQHNGIIYDTQHNDTQHKGIICNIQHNNALPLCLVSLFIYYYAKCHYADCRSAA